MSREVALILLSLGVLQLGAQAKYASGARRAAHRLMTRPNSPPLEQHQVASVARCLNLCDGVAECVALNYGAVHGTLNCELLAHRACDGLTLVAEPAVDYYDVYDAPQELYAERSTPFWDGPSCVQDGYCAAECAAEAVGDFCTVDAHCSVKLMPPGAHRCRDRTCQTSADFWELRPGLALPRWQLWRLDWKYPAFKGLTPDICTLDIEVKLGTDAWISLAPGWEDDDQAPAGRLEFRITTLDTDIHYYDEQGTLHRLVEDARTPGMVDSTVFRLLRISWCNGTISVGPREEPTLVTAQLHFAHPIEYLMGRSKNAASRIYIDSGAADRWLFEDSGVAEDAIMELAPDEYAFRNITAANDVTVKYDCMARVDCNVALQNSAMTRVLIICVGCWHNMQSGLTYQDQNTATAYSFANTGTVLSTSEFNTFTVRYTNSQVTIHRNDDPTPIYSVTPPEHMADIDIIGIGGCCSRKYVRAARYDPAWRTDTWLTEGRGYSNGDIRA